MDTKKEKYAVFVLDPKHTAIDPRRSGTNRALSIPAKDVIYSPDHQGVMQPRVIAYLPESGQKSIYVDEWKNYKGETDIRQIRAPKISFNDKVKILDPVRHPLLVEFLRVTNSNGSNENRDSTKEAFFFEEKVEEKAEQSYKDEQLIFRATEFIFNARFENLLSVAEMLTIPTTDRNGVDLTETELKMDLTRKAKKDPLEVIEIFQNPRLEAKIQITRAFTMRHIYFDKVLEQIMWNDTKIPVIPKKIRKGLRPEDVLVNYCSDSGADGKEVYNEILYKINGGEVNDIVKENPKMVDSFTNEELVEAAKDAGILVVSGAYLYLDNKEPKNKFSGKGKNAVISLLEENAMFNDVNLKEYIVRRLKEAIALKLG